MCRLFGLSSGSHPARATFWLLEAPDTDSERFFALITKEIEAAGGDVTAGIGAAARWVAGSLPVFSMNLVLVTATGLWALRYPDTHDLFVLERGPGGPAGGRHLDHASAARSIRVRSGDLATHPSVVVATERMDEDPGWRQLSSGSVLHVGPELQTRTTEIVPEPPAHRLTLADLDAHAAASQEATPRA